MSILNPLPTLEEIAKDALGFQPFLVEQSLARELIALREWRDAFEREEMIEAFQRISALEQQSRGYAEDGALAAGRGADDGPGTIIARQRGLWDAIDRFQDEVSAATGWSIVSAKAYEGEFIRFVDAVIRQRDEYRSLLSSTIRERTTALAQRDTARAALRKYGVHSQGCPAFDYRSDQDCTCGFEDALAGGEANEGSGDEIR